MPGRLVRRGLTFIEAALKFNLLPGNKLRSLKPRTKDFNDSLPAKQVGFNYLFAFGPRLNARTVKACEGKT